MKRRLIILAAAFTILAVSFSYNDKKHLQFLNDRAGDIIGSTSLGAPGFITPGGLTGEGQVVAIADSGLDRGSMEFIHPDLRSTPGQKPKVIMLKSWAGREKADDPLGHGTHMAAAIAGTGAASEGQFKGVAPGASLYFQGILDSENNIRIPLPEKLFLPAYEAGARIHVDAWGGGKNHYSGNAQSIDSFANRHRDFLVVLGAGNSGPGEGTLTAEANSKNALVVGASCSPRPALDPENTDSGGVAAFSSRGPAADGRIKPELLAPGTTIVSARSSLVSGNMPGFPEYLRMQGTSMAAAVTGGAAALTRELLQKELSMGSPSSALIKALLINGARSGPDPAREGFGVLNLTGSAISVKEKKMKLIDEGAALGEGRVKEYSFEADKRDGPFKATLVWNDPPAEGQGKALVNDLDLEVVSPAGQVIPGNSFLKTGTPDTVNNVEQVALPAVSGRYTIRIKAASINENISPGGQEFALVYGQLPLESEITDSAEQGLRGSLCKIAVDGKPGKEIEPGFRQYAVNNAKYIVGKTWYASGVQFKELGEYSLWSEVSRNQRLGGYCQAEAAEVLVNGKAADSLHDLPPGVSIEAVLDPVTQSLRRVKVDYEVMAGKVSGVNHKEKAVTLAGYREKFKINQSAAYLNTYDIRDSDPFISAFGPECGDLQAELLPGMPVELVINPRTDEVQSVRVFREVALGALVSVDTARGEILMDTGKVYRVLPGGVIYIDNQPSGLLDLKPGYLANAVLQPDSNGVPGLAAYTATSYGQIVFINQKEKTIYYNDIKEGFKECRYSDDLAVYRWGREDAVSSLGTDTWARLTFSPDKTVVAVHVAEEAGIIEGHFSGVSGGEVALEDGQRLSVSAYTRFEKAGFAVTEKDFLRGESISALTLYTLSGKKVIVLLESKETPQGISPDLKYVSLPLNRRYFIGGITEGDMVYIWRAGGARVEITPDAKGEFSYSFIPGPDEKSVRLVAVNRKTGGVSGSYIEINSKAAGSFTDVRPPGSRRGGRQGTG